MYLDGVLGHVPLQGICHSGTLRTEIIKSISDI